MKPEQSDKDCLTCRGDPAVCATVPGLRHCEKAMRDPLPELQARGEDVQRESVASRLETNHHMNESGALICEPLTRQEANLVIKALRAPLSTSGHRIDLTLFVNAASINGNDYPHTVVEKLQKALDAANVLAVQSARQDSKP